MHALRAMGRITPMSVWLIAVLVGIGVYALIMIAIPRAAPQQKDANLKSALERLYEENRASEAAQDNVLRDQLNEETPVIRTIFGLPFMKPLYEAGLQAGYQNNLKQLLLMMVMGLAGGIIATLLFGLGWAGFVASLLLAYFVPYKYCTRKTASRNRKFIDQFPDALDMIVRSVRSGFPLTVALQMLAENAEEPVREEFRKVNDDIALGRNLSQALARLATRINEPDIRFFVVVLSVQQETGGNLSEIIGNLSNVIRKRKQLRHKIRAMTSEGKATGYVLGALPVLVFVALWFLQPSYLMPFFDDTMGNYMFGGTIFLMVLCFFIIKAMINVDI